MKREIDYEKSSGNVFEDIGFKNPENEALKAQLTLQIFKIIERRQLTQVAAAALLEISQPEVSKLKHGYYSRFGVGRLFSFLNRLNCNIDIHLTQARNHHPCQRVCV